VGAQRLPRRAHASGHCQRNASFPGKHSRQRK